MRTQRKSLIPNKKGQALNQFTGLITSIVTISVILTVGFLILSNVKANTQVAADANATAAINTLTATAAGLPDWVDLVVLVSIGAILIGLVVFFKRVSD